MASLGYNREVPLPDISTKTRAQEFIGMDMKKLNSEKKDFIEKITSDWIKAEKGNKK